MVYVPAMLRSSPSAPPHTRIHTHACTSRFPAFALSRVHTLFNCCCPSQQPAWPSGPPLYIITSSRKLLPSPKPMDPLLPRQPVDSSWVSSYTLSGCD